MCTVTWVPDGKGGAILTSNRDEAPHRSAVKVEKRPTAGGERLLFPVDEGAGGTWICVSDRMRAVCLLNGAKRRHRHRPPYRRSRGLVVLDAFEFPDFDTFVRQVDLKGIEPFTMVLAEGDQASVLWWNGRAKDIEAVPGHKPAIWASSTLYPYPVRQRRLRWFRQFLTEHPSPGMEEILDFHLTDNGDRVHGLVINRDERVKTVSVTSARLGAGTGLWQHHDLVRDQIHRYDLGA